MAASDVLGTRSTVAVPAGTLEYRERGSGRPIVFVHGAAVNGDLWRAVAPAFADEHRCVVVDLPLGGHAIPLRPGVDMSLFGLADILASFLDALDLHDVMLVANDTGGAISQALVSRGADCVSRLVLTSCDAFDTYPPRAIAYLKPTVRVPPALWLLTKAMRRPLLQRTPLAYGWATHAPMPPEIMRSYLGGIRANPGVRRDFAGMLRMADRRDMRRASESVGAFTGPALVIWGADDRFFPRADGEELARLLPGGRFELVPDSRTFIPEDQPARLVELLRGFVEREG